MDDERARHDGRGRGDHDAAGRPERNLILDAFLLGAAARSSLVLSGLAVYLVKVPQKVVGAFAGFGAGALIAAIAFDLIPQGEGLEYGQLALWLLVGGGCSS
jgi:ZIP family zinc transporter